jgi:hypothetical protein
MMDQLFSRQDWTLFRSLSTLGQRAGVTQEVIPALVAKELVDNALDAAGTCRYGLTDDGRGLFVEDDGDGLPGTDTEVAALFSVARPLSSSKLLRLPTRGALGNGLRVVAGAVLASGGRLTVKTCGRALRLRPRDADGMTDVQHVKPWKGTGTRVEIVLGDALPIDADTFQWATRADAMATTPGTSYRGATSPWWYDSDSFYELTQAAGVRPVRALVESFAGCSGAKASKVAADFTGRPCESLTRHEAETLLAAMRRASRQVNAKRLGAVGHDLQPSAGYARVAADFQAKPARGKLPAVVPVVVEAWASAADTPAIAFYVNRTPITAEIHASRCMKDKGTYGIMGCSLSDEHRNTASPVKVSRGREYSLVVNVTTPYMPVTTDGKAPDLSVIGGTIRGALEKAIRRAKRKSANGNGRQISQAAVITKALPAAIDKASGGGQHRYNQRQLFYVLRPHVLDALGVEPSWDWFCKVVTKCEADRGGDLPGIYRDDRGTLYHPHTGEYIPLGTRAVEEYRRPEWTFNKVLYCEKEGFFATLIDAQWPERHDCALLTSKGYGSRAARDVLDLLGDSDEPLTFYCVHDADGPGTMIYQTLQEATAARPRRRVEIVNLGLDPAEALDMGLPVEPAERKDGKRVPVADYIPPGWRDWLQTHRIELNAMDTSTFLKWLDAKMDQASGKLIPPPDVLAAYLCEQTRVSIRQALTHEAIATARVEQRTDEAMTRVEADIGKMNGQLDRKVRRDLAVDPARAWREPVAEVAAKLTAKRRPQPQRGARD